MLVMMALLIVYGTCAALGKNADGPVIGIADSPRRVAAPMVKPAMVPLPPGAVEPQGWLRDWAVAARVGITGHLDEYHPVFADAWKGIPINWSGANPDGTGWPLEQCAYWLDGAIRLGLILHDEALIGKIRARLDPIVAGVNQAEFGASFIYWKKGFKPAGFDSWAHSHMGRALVALYQGTGDKRVLDALVKVYADYPVTMGGLRVSGGGDVSGLCNIDAMMETYSYSGDRRILERTLAAIRQEPVESAINAWHGGTVDWNHMVIIHENLRLPALMYPWAGNERYLQATKRAFRWLDENNMLPYGVTSGEEYAAGIGAARKTETCIIPALLNAAAWMSRIDGAGEWGDRMEKAFFNAGAGPIARDFETAAYYQSPNRIRDGLLPIASANPHYCDQLTFSKLACAKVLCCIGAVNRILPYFIINMWMTTGDNGLAATLHGPATASAFVGAGVGVKVRTVTAYPFEETIRMTITPNKPVVFPLYLRIPSWCGKPTVQVNGEVIVAESVAKMPGYVRISRTWKERDAVTLILPMPVKIVRGFESEYPLSLREYFHIEPDSMFQKRRLPYASITFGPLLFALPIPDTDANTPVEGARWQYALDIDPSHAVDIKVDRRPMPQHWDWPLDAPISLTVSAMTFDWKPTNAEALPPAPVKGNQAAIIRLIPYGCTKFRISMFPVTAKTLMAK